MTTLARLVPAVRIPGTTETVTYAVAVPDDGVTSSQGALVVALNPAPVGEDTMRNCTGAGIVLPACTTNRVRRERP
jgi:hypothetical protein